MIDSVYEYAGFSLAEGLREMLSGLGLPLIVGLGGTAWLVQRMAADRASIRDLGFHVVALVLTWWLLSPTRSEGMAAPRFAVWLGQAADAVQRRAVALVNRAFLDRPFEWERVAALAQFARVQDPALRRRVEAFLRSCARPALAAAEPAGADLFAEGALPYSGNCEEVRGKLRAALERHVAEDPLHRAALQAARQLDPAGADRFAARYLKEVCVRAVDDPLGPTGELKLVADSIGSYGYLDRPTSVGSGPEPLNDAANLAIGVASELQQAWRGKFEAKQRYYLVTVYGPHVYGLVTMLLVGLFPLAGLWALWPGHAKALVNWGTAFVSVKLWPVCWAALSAFNAKRSAIEAFDPGPRGSGDVFLAVAAMYALTPAVAYALVHVAARAAALPFSPALPAPSGPGLGPAGAAASVAARAGR
jgi:hypothetical protein